MIYPTMIFTDMQWELFDFVKQHHANQKRKYTGEPCLTHLLRVVEILQKFGVHGEEIEIGLCHDILENTFCTKQEMSIKLKEIGYDLFPRNKIIIGIYNLTDIYTPEQFADLSRSERKQKEAERMEDLEFFSQTVKYAELIDNIPSVARYDPEFAWIYLNEISAYIGKLNEGNEALYLECRKVLDIAINSLVSNHKD